MKIKRNFFEERLNRKRKIVILAKKSYFYHVAKTVEKKCGISQNGSFAMKVFIFFAKSIYISVFERYISNQVFFYFFFLTNEKETSTNYHKSYLTYSEKRSR